MTQQSRGQVGRHAPVPPPLTPQGRRLRILCILLAPVALAWLACVGLVLAVFAYLLYGVIIMAKTG